MNIGERRVKLCWISKVFFKDILSYAVQWPENWRLLDVREDFIKRSICLIISCDDFDIVPIGTEIPELNYDLISDAKKQISYFSRRNS